MWLLSVYISFAVLLHCGHTVCACGFTTEAPYQGEE